jgi:hypothetical protein
MLADVEILGDRNVLKKEAELIPPYGEYRMKCSAHGM